VVLHNSCQNLILTCLRTASPPIDLSFQESSCVVDKIQKFEGQGQMARCFGGCCRPVGRPEREVSAGRRTDPTDSNRYISTNGNDLYFLEQ
jgi:hypothetical protein